jgi:anaerobic magnesium-protoporphyrin IX monomethyl ester cyclase
MPYASLGVLYLCSHLRKKGFGVDVFDMTFSSREESFRFPRAEAPSLWGLYPNLMTRSKTIETLHVAHEAGWKNRCGEPKSDAYITEHHL